MINTRGTLIKNKTTPIIKKSTIEHFNDFFKSYVLRYLYAL